MVQPITSLFIFKRKLVLPDLCTEKHESFERLIWQIPNRQSIQDERIDLVILYSVFILQRSTYI